MTRTTAGILIRIYLGYSPKLREHFRRKLRYAIEIHRNYYRGRTEKKKTYFVRRGDYKRKIGVYIAGLKIAQNDILACKQHRKLRGPRFNRRSLSSTTTLCWGTGRTPGVANRRCISEISRIGAIRIPGIKVARGPAEKASALVWVDFYGG